MTESDFVRSIHTTPPAPQDWGQLIWLVGRAEMPDSEQTFGMCTIHPGRRNPLHSHPNCEELLYVVSGTCDHKLGDDMLRLRPGDVIRIPRGVRHWARCTSAEPLVALIAFSSADRQAESHEDAGAA